jgi:large repetitive protein
LFDINVNDNGTRTIYVNLAGPSGQAEGKPWNNLVSYPFANTVLANLKDEEDVTTPYSFRLVDQWTQGFMGGMITGNNSGVYPDNVILSSIYESTTNAKRIQFTGLNPSRKYNVGLFCSNNAGFDATATFTSGASSVTVNAMYNSNAVAQLNDLVPNVSGVIEITMTKASAATYAFLNAVVLQEYDNTVQLVRPIQLFAEPGSPDKIKLTWSDRSANETGFEIWRANSGGSYSLLTTVPANTTTYTNTGLTGNTRYYYRVRAINGAITSDYSNTAQAILASYMVNINLNLVLPQGAPWNNTNSAPVEGAGIDAMLNSQGNNTGFSMEVTRPFGGHFDLGMTNGVYPDNVMLTSWWVEGGGQTGTLKFLNLDQSKRYRIGFFGSSSWTGDFTGTYTINNRVVYLNAHRNTSKTVYIDNVITNSDGEINIDFSSISTARWAFTSAIILEVYQDDGSSEPVIISNRVFSSPIVQETPAVQEPLVIKPEIIREVKVFPNPFSESLNVLIAIEKKSNIAVAVFDVNGKLIYKQPVGYTEPGTRSLQLNAPAITGAKAGMYILQVLVDGKPEKVVRLVKTK